MDKYDLDSYIAMSIGIGVSGFTYKRLILFYTEEFDIVNRKIDKQITR